MKAIQQYVIRTHDKKTTIALRGEVVAVHEGRGGEILLFAMDDEEAVSSMHTFQLVTTRQELPEGARYVGTVFGKDRFRTFPDTHVIEVETPQE